MQAVQNLRRFMEEAGGREFAMLNRVRLDPDPLSHPETGEPRSPGTRTGSSLFGWGR